MNNEKKPTWWDTWGDYTLLSVAVTALAYIFTYQHTSKLVERKLEEVMGPLPDGSPRQFTKQELAIRRERSRQIEAIIDNSYDATEEYWASIEPTGHRQPDDPAHPPLA